MAFKILILVTVGLLAASVAALDDDVTGPLSNTCLGSINDVVGSADGGCTGMKCGPLQITFEQWKTAYNIKGNDANEYLKCMKSVQCSVRTLQEYMGKTLQLCVRRTPNTDRFRTVCESALILHTENEETCRTDANTGKVRENREKLLENLNRRASTWLSEGLPEPESSEEDGSGSDEDYIIIEESKPLVDVLDYVDGM